ncbi:MAG: hypothetical protein ACI4VG_03565 [Lachnospiraceae bacterium]
MNKAIEEVAVEEVREVTEAPNAVQGQVEEVIERPYTLRKFKDGDLYPLLLILKKIGIKDCKEAFVQVATGEKTLKQIGMLAAFDLADVLIGNLTKAEAEIYSLYADISGISVEEIKEMEFGTLPLMIMDSFKEVKNTSFFKVLSRLL